MANATVTVLEADGVTQTDVFVLDFGRQAAAASKSVAASTEDKAVLDAIAASLAILDDFDESDRAKVNLIVGQAGIAAGAGAVGATVPRMTLASDDPAVAALEAIETATPALGTALAANSIPVVEASDSPVITALQIIDNPVLVDDAAFTPATSSVMMAGFQADEASIDSVNEGDAGAARMTLDRKVIVNMQPHTAGGMSVFRSLDLDETHESVKASAGCLFKLRAANRTTSLRYLKIYDHASPTVGTTTPVDTIVLPAGAASDACVVTENFGGLGLMFATAITMAVTTGLADNDTGAPGANDVVVTAYYI